MPNSDNPKVVSANHLLDGDVVYLDAEARWTRALSRAAVARTDKEAQDLLSLADQPGTVVGPYLIDVAPDASGHLAPTHFREKFRETGPSNRPDIGRQADLRGAA